MFGDPLPVILQNPEVITGNGEFSLDGHFECFCGQSPNSKEAAQLD